MLPTEFSCYYVTKDAAGNVAGRITTRPLDELPPGDVLVRVVYSSLNFKDALAVKGHPGVTKKFPHVPGVDAAGVVAESGVYEFVEGDRVLVTGFDMGADRWGGYAAYVRVPQEWLVPLPAGLSLEESMTIGTAGFTAALSIDALKKHGVEPGEHEVVVTGASGGVGSMAVDILAKLGYRVAAVSGKPAAREYLTNLGAARILTREEADDRSSRPLLHGQWAGAVDTVGGNILASILRATRYGGCVTACGLTAGHSLALTVYPFILRAVSLIGIDAAWCPLAWRHRAWQRLGDEWKPPHLVQMGRVVELPELPHYVAEILAGRIMGRVVVKIGEE
jgi:putative YhdH/YhfP family quinone oxidoreductase